MMVLCVCVFVLTSIEKMLSNVDGIMDLISLIEHHLSMSDKKHRTETGKCMENTEARQNKLEC